MIRLETDRLVLRSWSLADAEDLFAYARLDTVGPKAGWKPHENISESREIIKSFMESDDVWAIQHKQDGKVIGSVGIHMIKSDPDPNTRELGYVLSTEYEHQGLMTEACHAVLRYVFNETAIDSVVVCHFLGNHKSQRVIEKCGFEVVGEREHVTRDNQAHKARFYKLTKSQFIANGGNRMNTWNLDKLYTGFESDQFQNDLKLLDDLVETIKGFESQLHDHENAKEKLLKYVQNSIALSEIAERLFSYASLRQSTDSTNIQSLKYLNQLQMKMTELTIVETLFMKWLKDVPDLEDVLAQDPLLEEHRFHFEEQKARASHLLDDATEALIAKLRQSGSIAWDHLQSLLTSTLAVDYDGKEITLSEVRNLAYEADPKVRERAFVAELKAYEKIDKAIASAINSIKGEVNTLTEARGYGSPLEQTLIQSRMKKETLDVMIETMEAYLPVFRTYLKRKAKLLGHQNGLPFYDLFAPIGNTNKTFTIPEANDYVLKNFHTFNERLYQMAKKAFSEGWLDYLPRKGKVGGAFCANLHVIKESRILTNFNGAFGDVITMAHELGHAYHGEAIFEESPLNADYTMPVAETASTFCETIVNQAALNDATTKEERIYLLESSLQDATQVIVDILSRFYFEKALFEGRRHTLYDAEELKNMMLDAQKKSYGDGLDETKLHPYMWVCKSHYYSGTLSYYNFPYAFGLLFAKGLYAKYLEDKQAFVPMYDKLLAATGKNFVEDAAMIANIDVTDKAFWQGSLELLKADVDLFLKLTE